MEIHRLDADTAHAAAPALADILMDCIAGGASVSFMAGLTRADAEDFWHDVAASVGRGERLLIAAGPDQGEFVGTVQVIVSTPPNQPHRGEIAKMLVRRDARHRGVGGALMDEAETAARRAGKTILTLDTVTGGDGYRLYRRQGWQIAGEIPDYALWPDGSLCPTTFMWKRIA